MIKLGIYKHSKSGKEYRVVGIAKHSETLEDLVVYEPLYESASHHMWVRPVGMWEEPVEINGEEVPRFTFINS